MKKRDFVQLLKNIFDDDFQIIRNLFLPLGMGVCVLDDWTIKVPRGVPSNFIYIQANLPNFVKLAVAIHENAHYQCYKHKCGCLKRPCLRERHAYIATLEELLRRELACSLFREMWALAEMSKPKNYNRFWPHSRAAQSIINTSRIWKKCKTFLGDSFTPLHP